MLSGKPYSTEPLRSTLLFCPSSLMPTASPFPLACRPHYMNHWGHMWGILLIGCFELPPNLGGELHIDHTRRLISLYTESGLVTDVYIYFKKEQYRIQHQPKGTADCQNIFLFCSLVCQISPLIHRQEIIQLLHTLSSYPTLRFSYPVRKSRQKTSTSNSFQTLQRQPSQSGYESQALICHPGQDI